MKLNKTIFLLLGVTLLLTAPSCNKFLDKEPDNRTDINSITKVAQLVASAYPNADYYTFTEAASDNAEDKGNGSFSATPVFSMPYFWKDYAGSDVGSTTNYWNSCYAAIAAANQALQTINENGLGNAVLPYKGEALVARAYAHFMLVTFFAKEYTIGNANNTPGIPYVTTPETTVIKQYERETVQSIYQKIEKDLTEGLPLLVASAYSAPKFHFTPAAARAFAARFYLFKGEWQKVIDYANQTVPGGDYSNMVRPTNSTLKNLIPDEFSIAFTKSDQKYNLLLTSQTSVYQRVLTSRYGFGFKLATMFGQGNITGKNYENFYIILGPSNCTTFKFKDYASLNDQTSNTGDAYLIAPLFTTDEALLNRAEAYAKLDRYDNALKDVNTILANIVSNYSLATDEVTQAKITAFYNTTDVKAAIIALILDIKKAVFLQEGIRWLDIVRNHLPVTHNFFDQSDAETFMTLQAGDNRRVFQIPEQAKLSGVQPNPR